MFSTVFFCLAVCCPIISENWLWNIVHEYIEKCATYWLSLWHPYRLVVYVWKLALYIDLIYFIVKITYYQSRQVSDDVIQIQNAFSTFRRCLVILKLIFTLWMKFGCFSCSDPVMFFNYYVFLHQKFIKLNIYVFSGFFLRMIGSLSVSNCLAMMRDH